MALLVSYLFETLPCTTESLCTMFLLQHIKDSRVLLVALLVVFGAYLLYSPNYEWSESYGSTPFAADFLQEWVGARMILSGEAELLYTNQFIENQHSPQYVGFSWDAEDYFPAVYPPPHYLLFCPFGLVSYQWAGFIWLFLQILFVYLTWMTLKPLVHEFRSKEIGEASKTSSQTSSLWLAVLLFPPLMFSIAVGQKSTLWMMWIATAMSLFARGKEFRGGMVFGLLSIKPTLFFLLPLIAFKQKRWRFLAGCLVSGCLVWGVCFSVMPLTVWGGFMEVARGAGAFAENPGYRIDWSCNLLTLAYSLSPHLVSWGKVAICTPLAIYVIYSVLCCASELARPLGWLMVLAGTALLSPHFYYYDLCVLLPGLVWLWASSPRESVAVYVLLAVGCSVSALLLEFLGVPILPILLIGVVTSLALRDKLASASQNLSIVVARNLQPHS